jgi:hypothetical protein
MPNVARFWGPCYIPDALRQIALRLPHAIPYAVVYLPLV